MIALQEKFSGVFFEKGRIYTKNLAPGKSVYGEQRIERNGTEYREWSPWRSKLGAGIMNGLKDFPIEEGSRVLYLGCAEGTTCSHLSDIVGLNGIVFGIDISQRSMRKFVFLSEERHNLIPFLGDASKPETYEEFMREVRPKVLVQDVSQKNQSEIFLSNASAFLPKGCFGLLSVKARSIDSSAKPEKVFAAEAKALAKSLEVKQVVPLKPYEKDHALISCLKR